MLFIQIYVRDITYFIHVSDSDQETLIMYILSCQFEKIILHSKLRYFASQI